MARKSFSISVNNDTDLNDIGAMAPTNAGVGSISKERIAQLQALMAKPSNAVAPDASNDRLDVLIPANNEQQLDINKLVPAPDDWNFFGKPNEEQYALIFQSIYTYGLWHPCTVWEQEDGSYMILGGHTRHMVYRELYAVTQDEKYLSIPCKVYKHDQINEVTARRIIILTNIAQRAQESSKIRVRCYCEMARLEKMDAFYGAGIDVNTAVAKLFGVSRATVAFWRRLESLIEPLLIALQDKQITQNIASMLCDLMPELQEYIYEQNYHTQLTSKMRSALKAATTPQDIDNIIKASTQAPEKYQYVFSTKVKKPLDYDFIPLAVSHDEVAAFKSFLTQSLDLADGISDKTKQIILEMIKR